jgi:hypothetical protein
MGLCLSRRSRRVAAAVIFGPGLISSIPTFESAGLYWSPLGGGPDKRAYATFHQADDPQERTSLDFVWDKTAGEYRGSLLLLESGSDYDVTLWIEGRPVQKSSFTTWSDTFPIARTVPIPTGVQTEPYLIDDVHGSPQGYILYEPSDGRQLDGRNVDYSIQIQNSSYIIIRGFTIVGTVKSSIYVNKASTGGVNDVVIENNEIANWGRIVLYTENLRGTITAGDTISGATSGASGIVTEAPVAITKDGFNGHVIYYANDNGIRFQDGETISAASGGNFTTHQTIELNGYVHGFGGYGADDYAIATDDMDGTASRLIIQRNQIHTPRADTNAWNEYFIIPGGEIGEDPPRTIRSHPIGPGGIFMEDTAGNHVIRYNTVHGTPGRAPSQGDKNGHYIFDGIGGRPDGTTGSVHRDSDVYRNDIRYVWDDGIEVEGFDLNVRIWGNLLDETFVSFGLAPVAEGPLYVFGNIAHRSRKSYFDGYRSGTLIKGETSSGGYVFILHNTAWAGPDPGAGGMRTGIKDTTEKWYVRNNLVRAQGNAYTGDEGDANIDYEMYHGRVKAPLIIGADSINAEAIFAAPDSVFLAPGTPGQGDALILPNLEWTDRGAEQTGQPPLAFGHSAGHAVD